MGAPENQLQIRRPGSFVATKSLRALSEAGLVMTAIHSVRLPCVGPFYDARRGVIIRDALKPGRAWRRFLRGWDRRDRAPAHQRDDTSVSIGRDDGRYGR